MGQNRILGDVRIEPGVMTPNNDGVNDRTTFHFSVGRLSADKAVRVTIHDLSGAAVRELVERREDPRGDFAIPWSGEDDSLQLVPPGIYLPRIPGRGRRGCGGPGFDGMPDSRGVLRRIAGHGPQ
jgi:hypothetical protein